MATKQDIAAAMSAIAGALRPSLRERIAGRWRSLLGAWAPSPHIAEIRAEIEPVARYLMLERPADQPAARAALEAIAMRFGLDVVEDGDWGDDDESHVEFDLYQLDESLSRARLGQFDDALHHLERALPEGYGDIALRLDHAFRSAR